MPCILSSDAIEKSLSGLNYYLEEENEEKEVEGEEGEEEKVKHVVN